MIPTPSFSSDRVRISASAAEVPAVVYNGCGFTQTNRVCIDTDAPTGNVYMNGLRISPAGSIYGTTTTDPLDVILGGVRVTQAGQLVYVDGPGVTFCNGLPVDANGALATVNA